MKLKYIIRTILLIVLGAGHAQNMTQTIRGKILDNDTQVPLIGATIRIVDAEPIKGSVTDIDGNFRIENVPVGRVTLLINYMGYEDKLIPNLLISVAKEVVLDIPIIESINNLDEIVISAKQSKADVLNEMATVSARSFSVEETKRYAGSFNDPARMVASFAGVTSNAEGNNDIVVRGNSPKGILWRLEGVEIPNPNHFAWEGSTGGPINALNSNMLNDSDFFSGAFAPEYGNALSGVFDMKLKKGNNERKEYTATASTLGLDFTVEGPFKGGYDGSYLANYRYSSLALIDNLGIVDFGGVPKYQDLCFNVNLPINKKNIVSTFGLGGLSSISQEWEEKGQKLTRSKFQTGLGVIGISHTLLVNEKSFLKTTVSGSGTLMKNFDELPDDSEDGYYNVHDANLSKSDLKIASTYNHKFNAKQKVESGFIYTHRLFNLKTEAYNFDNDRMETELTDKGSADAFQGFTTWKYRISENWTMTSGLHYLFFALNESSNIEPRLGLRYDLSPRQSFSAGFGLHSKLETISTYLAKNRLEDGTMITPNKDLKTTKASHFVIGYDFMINLNTHLKLETYYQHLYNVPIENSDTSTFSMINRQDSYLTTAMINNGTGRNYGAEVTLEQYLHKGFYYMFTGSFYESLYTPGDGVERKTAFNGNYAVNFLAGKEFKIGKPGKNKVLFINGKIALIGGNRYTPIDYESSVANGYEVRYDDLPYTVKGDDIFITNIAIGTRKNKRNTTREFKVDVQNATNNKALVNQYYLSSNEKIYKGKQLPLFPTISYTFSF